MTKGYQNKEIRAERPAAEPSGTVETYFFPGKGKYKPVSVEASTPQEAQEKWDKVKELTA
jgi:hypothetical protein